MENEIWKPVVGFDNYEVSSLGRLRSIDRFETTKSNRTRPRKGVLFSPVTSIHGYKRALVVNNNNKRKQMAVHRLVALAFLPNPENKPCVNHKNSNRTDNRVENLEWCTQKENVHHSRTVNGMSNDGERNPIAKFSNAQAASIRKEYQSGLSVRQLSRKHNVGYYTIQRLVRYLSYKTA